MSVKNILAIALFSLTLLSCKSENNEQNIVIPSTTVDDNPVESEDETNPISTDQEAIEYRAEAVENNEGWGYIIYQDDKAYINQPHIPAISGLKSFKSEQDALKTGNFAISKIEKGIMPPTITKDELDSLGVLY